MKKNRSRGLVPGVGVGLILVLPLLGAGATPTWLEQSPTITPGSASPVNSGRRTATRARVDQAYGKLPLTFEANRGQTDTQVKFLSRGQGYTLFLTSTETVFVLTKSEPPAKRDTFRLLKPAPRQPKPMTRAVVRMKLVGANPVPRVAGLEELPGKANYFIGNDPKKWRTNVPTYARVEYKDVYPGVNLVYYGN